MASRLEKVYREAERICIDRSSRIVCMSDCHRGVGNLGDNFLPNENLFLAAMKYYFDRCFLYIELGDGDELWENKDLRQIAETHSDTFCRLSEFYRSGRLVMLYGNHDCQKKKRKCRNKCCRTNLCDKEDILEELFSGIRVREGLVLEDCATGHEIFLVHGHQGDFLNDTLWPFTKFMVRHVWRPLEMLGVANPTSAAYNDKKCKKTEKRLDSFSEEKQILVMAGHTHRPVLPGPGEGLYLNDGCCVHPRYITAMEIANGAITLVKWRVEVRPDLSLAVAREILKGPYAWEQYWK